MRENRTSGSEGGGATSLPTPINQRSHIRRLNAVAIAPGSVMKFVESLA